MESLEDAYDSFLRQMECMQHIIARQADICRFSILIAAPQRYFSQSIFLPTGGTLDAIPNPLFPCLSTVHDFFCHVFVREGKFTRGVIHSHQSHNLVVLCIVFLIILRPSFAIFSHTVLTTGFFTFHLYFSKRDVFFSARASTFFRDDGFH